MLQIYSYATSQALTPCLQIYKSRKHWQAIDLQVLLKYIIWTSSDPNSGVKWLIGCEKHGEEAK